MVFNKMIMTLIRMCPCCWGYHRSLLYDGTLRAMAKGRKAPVREREANRPGSKSLSPNFVLLFSYGFFDELINLDLPGVPFLDL